MMKVLGLSSVLVFGLVLTGCSASPTPEEQLATYKEQLACMFDENDWDGLIDQITESQADFYQIMRVSADFELEDYREDLIDTMIASSKPTRELSEVFLYEFSDCQIPGMQSDATQLGLTLRSLAAASFGIRGFLRNIDVKSWEDSVRERDALVPIMNSIQSKAEAVLEQCEALAPPEDPDC
jgi:hypothetical protein